MGDAASRTQWVNWARTASSHPVRVERPRDVLELAACVADAAAQGLRVRAVGAGHSFTAAAVTDGVQLVLDALDAVEDVQRRDDGTTLVTVGAGIRLAALNDVLAALGLALRNLGDIDRQSIAGAVSTGTHGTGVRLGGLATQVVAARLVTADGRVVETSPTQEPELFELARLGLGSAGVLAAVTLETVPAFLLQAVEEPWPLEAVLEQLDGPDGLVEANHHFEFYWFPHTRRALTKRNNRVQAGQGLNPVRRWIDDELLSNTVFEATNRLATAAPVLTRPLNAVAARSLSARTYVAPSPQVFASPRRVRFREMEYALPRAAVRDVLAEVDRWIESSGERLPFPAEIRFAAADDLWLSTAHGRDTAYLAVHQYWRLPHQRYFAAVERIVAEHAGRPHWGKLHGLDAQRLAELYPRFGDAQRVRAAADPDGVFDNPYLTRVFGPRA